MFTSLPSSLIFSSLLLAATARPVESAATELRQLSASNFSSITKNGVWFVEYFSPWCSHCRNFAPTWEQLVEHVEGQDNPGISLAQVNCIAEGDLCNDNKVRAYPSLKLYEDGKEVDEFRDDREFDILTKYVADHARKRSKMSSKSLPNPEGVVLQLDKDLFKDTIADGPTFVKFFAPWCGHCKKLAPTWIQFAARMKDKVTVAEVNCVEHSSLCSQQKVTGYPMIHFYQHGRTLDYTGRRTLQAMEAFADTALAPTLKSISIAEVPSAVQKEDVVYFLVHDNLNPDLQDRVEEAAQSLHGTPPLFAVQQSPQLLSSFSLAESQELPVLIALKDHSMVPFNNLVLAFDTRISVISDWLTAKSLPISTELYPENFQRIMGPSPSSDAASHLVVLAALDSQNMEHVNVVKEVGRVWNRGAHANEGKPVVFTWMNREKWSDWLKSVYGIKKTVDPAVVIVDHGHLLYYDTLATGEPIRLQASSIISALDDVFKGRANPKHSENIAERFARWLNRWMLRTQSAMSEHPFRSVSLVVLVLLGVFFGMKRLLEQDARKTTLYSNSKSGTRLD